MGCFSVFPCFTNRKLNKSVNPTTPSSTTNQENVNNYEPVLIKVPTQESTNLSPFSKTRDDSEDILIKESDGETVAIDLDFESDECISVEEKNVKRDSGKLGFLVQIENEKERENDEKNENGKLGVLVEIENEKERKNEAKDGEEVIQEEIENEIKIDSEPKEENQSLGVSIELENEKEVQSQAVSDSSVSSYISYPPMHRYHNYVINEDEDEYEDEGEDDAHHVLIQEESSESLFSLSIDPRKQSKSCPVEVDDKEVNSPRKISYSPELFEINHVNTPFKVSSTPELIAKPVSSCAEGNDHNQKIDSMLNPIENLAQWKTLKARPIPISGNNQEKENVFLEEEEIPTILSEEPISKVPDRKGKVKTDTAVTTSLSSWLVEPEKSTVSKEESQSQYSTGNSYSCSAYSDGATSWKSFEDRPILGAWTINEVRQVSARSSPRKSPSHNPDETPIIGSVGSYWSHTGQATDSSNSYSSPRGMSAKSRRNRENKAKSCHSSPSKRRLERAFDRTTARVNL